MPKQRDFKAEYQRRKLSGLARGLTTRQSRGHAGKFELSVKDIRLAQHKKYVWVNKVFEIQSTYGKDDAVAQDVIRLYNQAKKENFSNASGSAFHQLREAIRDFDGETHDDIDFTTDSG